MQFIKLLNLKNFYRQIKSKLEKKTDICYLGNELHSIALINLNHNDPIFKLLFPTVLLVA